MIKNVEKLKMLKSVSDVMIIKGDHSLMEM